MLNDILRNGVKHGLWADEIDSITKNSIVRDSEPIQPTPVMDEYIPIMTSDNTPSGVASTVGIPFSGQPYNAFDGNDETSVYGATSSDRIILYYENANLACKPNKIRIKSINSGNTLIVKGYTSDGKSETVLYEEINSPIDTEFTDFIKQNYYTKFGITITGGNTTNTPAICTVQVYGDIKEVTNG